MTQKVLTISIAAYNVSQYLTQALDSIVASPELASIEAIVVNDGSTDNTSELVGRYVQRYPESVRLVDKENGGYGTTVNKGITIAQGRYFKILDGDDWFDTAALTHLVTYLKKCDADLVVMPRALVYEGKKPERQPIKLKAYTGEALSLSKAEDLFGHWNLAVSTAMARQWCRPLPEHTLYTDTLYTTYVLSGAENVVWFDEAVYCYRLGREGQSVSTENRVRHADENASVVAETCRFVESNLGHIHNEQYVFRKATMYYVHAVLAYALAPADRAYLEQIRSFEEQARREWRHIYEQAGLISRRIRLMRATGYRAYWALKVVGMKNWD